MKRIILFLSTLFVVVVVTAQSRFIARGAEPGEFYISCGWYGIYSPSGPGSYDTLRKAVFRISENGKKLSVQYDADYFQEITDSVMYPYYILTDATPGVLYGNVPTTKNSLEHTQLWVSFDYGKNWTFREKNIGANYYYPVNVEGLVYRATLDGIYKSEDYSRNFIIMENITRIGKEPGIDEEEFLDVNGCYPIDPYKFWHTNDLYQTYTEISIGEEYVFGSVSGITPDVFRGGLPGEVYIDSWFPYNDSYFWTYKVSFSADTGQTFRHVYISEPHHTHFTSSIGFMSDREQGVFYIIKYYKVEDTDPWGWHIQLCIDYYRDYGETLVDTYCHDVPKGYVNAIGDISAGSMTVQVYPNPTRGMINVQCLMINVQGVEVFDLMGRKVFEQKAEGRKQKAEWCLDISNLPDGMYFLRIISEQGVVVKKVVKN